MFADDNSDSQEDDIPKTEQEDEALLLKQEHAKFVLRSLIKQSKGMVGQDSGQPWFLF